MANKSKASKEELLRQVNHGEEMKKMTDTAAYQEIHGMYAKSVQEYYRLKQDTDIEGLANDTIRLQYVIDTERRIKYQLELFQYADGVIKKGKQANELLQTMSV